ncbi:hypothetical protein Agub_g7127 [Astrephomene gubernaculifera]|uniref:Uncharacterized protein n=1 Tax=Astrephomene gubernaculifera TaxID=47775 RepID=A0AAD3DPN1_9CHLO|nr:hypothetical protein Agub_g7127 [Astrephomene gubernaculifera]
MDRLTATYEALLAAVADAAKQLGEGTQQPSTRIRVEEARQDFINCCDVMCFQLKQSADVIRQEMVAAMPPSQRPAQDAAPQMDPTQVRQALEVAQLFAEQLRNHHHGCDNSGGGDAAVAGTGAAGGVAGVAGSGTADGELVPLPLQATAPAAASHPPQDHMMLA